MRSAGSLSVQSRQKDQATDTGPKLEGYSSIDVDFEVNASPIYEPSIIPFHEAREERNAFKRSGREEQDGLIWGSHLAGVVSGVQGTID